MEAIATMNNKKYNGWNNYQTWATALWIDNDYGSYQYRCELVERVKEEHEEEEERQNCLAIILKDWIEEQNPLVDSASLFTDLLNSALSDIDWQEIAENFLTELHPIHRGLFNSPQPLVHLCSHLIISFVLVVW